MNSTEKILAVVLVVAGLLGGYALYSSNHSTDQALNALGSQTVNYSSSAHLTSLYNNFASVVQDLTSLRNLFSGVQSTSTALVAPTFLRNMATSSLAGWSGLTVGDSCVVSVSSGTLQVAQTAEQINCTVTDSSTTLITFFVPPENATATAKTTYGLNIKVIPAASFVAPAALNTVTSTSN